MSYIERTTPVDPALSGAVHSLSASFAASESGSIRSGVSQRSRQNSTATSHEGSTQPQGLCSIGKRKIMILCTLCFARFLSANLGSLLAPFFPGEAQKKGATKTEIGLIFGWFQLMVFIMSPVFGHFMVQISDKFMFISGNFVLSACGILFGVLIWCPNGVVFVVMCFLVRSLEAIAAAAQGTANLAIAAHTFPRMVSTVMGILSAFGMLGLTVGPVVGGFLNDLGGYFLPFAVCGGISAVAGFSAICLLEDYRGAGDVVSNKPVPKMRLKTKLSLLTSPTVLLVGLVSFAAQFAIGYIDIALALHIQQDINRDISSVKLGLVFLIPTGIVVLLAPIYGYVADKVKWTGRPLLIIGTVVGGVAFVILGPCPLLPLPQNEMWLLIVSLVFGGLGWGSLVVAYEEFVIAARHHKFPEGMEAQGVISGTFNAINALGASIGPIAGGPLLAWLGFAWATTVIGFGIIFSGLLLLLYTIGECMCGSDEPYNQSTVHEDHDEDDEDNDDDRGPLITRVNVADYTPDSETSPSEVTFDASSVPPSLQNGAFHSTPVTNTLLPGGDQNAGSLSNIYCASGDKLSFNSSAHSDSEPGLRDTCSVNSADNTATHTG